MSHTRETQTTTQPMTKIDARGGCTLAHQVAALLAPPRIKTRFGIGVAYQTVLWRRFKSRTRKAQKKKMAAFTSSAGAETEQPTSCID